MKDQKRIKILLKVIERVCTTNPRMQKLIDESMTDVWKEEGVSSEQVFFYCCCLYRNGLSKHTFFVVRGKQPMKILEFTFSCDQEKNHVELCRSLFSTLKF